MSRFQKTLVFLLGFSLPALAQTVYVPASHWIYEFLDRMETKGVLPIVLDGTRPMTRWEIAGFVAQLAPKRASLSRAEREQLDFLYREFAEELDKMAFHPTEQPPTRLTRLTKHKWIDPWLPDFIYCNGRNFLSLQSAPFRLYWDPVLGRERLYADADTLSSSERVFKDGNGFVLWGTIGDHVGFLTDVRDTKEWGTRYYPYGLNYSDTGIGFAQGQGDYRYFDETIAYLTFQWKYLAIKFGKDKNQWGPGRHGQLALSDRSTSYDQLRIDLFGPRIRFSSLIAWLKHYETYKYFYGQRVEKAMAAHRLEFAPVRYLDIGLYETIVYRGRDLEPAYLNPVMFYRAADHYLGDSDNATLGLDFEFKAIPKTKLYCELFIDDLTTGKLGQDFYGNKYAYLLGMSHVDVLGLANLDFRMEYARIRPFVYTHHDSVSYAHFKTNLGHWIGPNADNLFLQLTFRHSRRLVFQGFYESLRRGANTPEINFGGSINWPFRASRDASEAPFLGGVLEKTRSFGMVARYEVIRNGFVQFRFRKDWGNSEWPQHGGVAPGNRTELECSASLNY